MAVCFECFLQLTIVLDDSVEHDREPAVLATRQRVRVLLVDRTVRRPTRVAETVIRLRAVRAGCVLQELEVADCADILEAPVLAQSDARRVVATILEAFETVEQQLLRGAVADVPDDPAHPKLLSVAAPCFRGGSKCCSFAVFRKRAPENAKSPAARSAPSPRRSAELSSHESCDRTTEGFGLQAGFRLGQHPDDGLRPRGSDQHPAAVAELGVEARDLLLDRRSEMSTRLERDILLRLRVARHHGSCLGECSGREERSSRPSAPSLRHRPSQR